jgi:hypothetical protein
MASTQAGSSILARTLPAVALGAVAAASALFALSTAPAADPSGIAAGQAASLSLPAWITAGLALLPQRSSSSEAARRRPTGPAGSWA